MATTARPDEPPICPWEVTVYTNTGQVDVIPRGTNMDGATECTRMVDKARSYILADGSILDGPAEYRKCNAWWAEHYKVE